MDYRVKDRAVVVDERGVGHGQIRNGEIVEITEVTKVGTIWARNEKGLVTMIQKDNYHCIMRVEVVELLEELDGLLTEWEIDRALEKGDKELFDKLTGGIVYE